MKWLIWLGALRAGRCLPSRWRSGARRRRARRSRSRSDIAPILYSQCASCHRPDGAAPFSLLTYDDVRQRATQIAAVTSQPLHAAVETGAGFGDFAGERRLTDEQIAPIDRWVATAGRSKATRRTCRRRRAGAPDGSSASPISS